MANSKCSRPLSCYTGRNNFSPGEMQRPILIISMVDKIDPRYTQHITTYNTYLNCICFLWPIQSARGLYACYTGRNNFCPGEMQRPILTISMVDKIDPRYTQHVTTYNTYLNCICFLWPIQSARGLYACYIGGNNFSPAEMQLCTNGMSDVLNANLQSERPRCQ